VRNLNVIRFAFNCIGNILTNTNFKVLDENQEIFNNIYDFLKEISSPQKLEDPTISRVLVTAMRVLSCLYIDLKLYPTNMSEFLFSQLIRYLYLGTSFFPLPKANYSLQGDLSSDSGVITSSSEISDTDDSIESKKEDETCAKIRNNSAGCLSNICRQNPKMIPQYFSTLLPCKVLRKEVNKFIENSEKPLILDPEFLEKRKRKTTYLYEFRNDFNEPTLLHLLLFEENNKVKISICKAISAILDGYQGDKLLLTIDGNPFLIFFFVHSIGEKLEKTKIEPYKSISHQIYQIFKNLTLAVTISILLETEETTLNHLLRVIFFLFLAC